MSKKDTLSKKKKRKKKKTTKNKKKHTSRIQKGALLRNLKTNVKSTSSRIYIKYLKFHQEFKKLPY